MGDPELGSWRREAARQARVNRAVSGQGSLAARVRRNSGTPSPRIGTISD